MSKTPNTIGSLSQTREEYGALALLETNMHSDPIEQFKRWFDDYAQSGSTTHNAMVLSSIDEEQHPDSRVVLLKGLENGEFIFFTHYRSVKGLQIEANPFVALNFYWAHQARQVRVRGIVHRIDVALSDQYFHSRPLESQLSSMALEQSMEISGRDALEDAYHQVFEKYADSKTVVRPESWGGYAVVPNQIEFWQGRDNRLHDRIQYIRHEEKWRMQRLAP
ncbi:MAG: pyridoxamine 5'-phosphate oxidase [Gammaproteobacteria bacterium]|nr:pyridoxamine 5'-phosphate oxidase [Gammaproteobacteria bacterium]